MSRLIIKNLPKTITENKLKNLFSQKGDITDIQLKYTSDGKFRHFGFIGYRTEEQAEEALNYFNNTCIGTHRITVEVCANLGDSVNKPKAWSKYAPENKNNATDNTSENKKSKPKNDVIEDESIQKIIDEHKSDPLFEEYLSTNLKNTTIWNNDDVLNLNLKSNEEIAQNEAKENVENQTDDKSEKLANATISDLEYMQSLMTTKPRQKTEKKPKNKLELFTVKVRGLPYKCKKKVLKDFFKPLVPYTIRIPQKVKGFAYIGFKSEKDFKKALLKDRSFISGKRVSVVKYIKKEDTNNNESAKFKNVPWKDKEELLKNEENIATSGKIFIRNLAYSITEDDIQKLFEKYGPLTEVNLPVDKTTRQIKGFGTVTFVFPEHAAKAYCELDGSVQSGRMLHLLPVKANDDDEKEVEGTNYKKQKELKQKNHALSSHNWNSLFVASDAVANTVAETYGTTKENLLGADEMDKKSTSAAVRLALGETQIVQDIRKYLELHDIYLDAFNSSNMKRSKTTLLVKNLPFGTASDEIRKLFEPFGPISRLILPPNGITAVVEYYESTEAKNSFKKLAYTKFKNVPLYLEWAPENVFRTAPTQQSEKTKKSNEIEKDGSPTKHESNETEVSDIKLEQQKKDQEVQINEDIEEPEPNTVLFVKNLNFVTKDEDLRKHFEKCGKLNYATVAMKNDPKNPGKKLSMGYGFVRYMRESDTDNALKTLQFSELDGKSLELKRSSRTTQDEVQTRKKTNQSKQIGTKILIKNIPFQANKKEIRDLFVPFGEIKALRLPQKLTGESHRGFAFVDYHTKYDAKQAFDALSQSTHLYGRRLVLEWAAADTEDINELRKRTANQMENLQKQTKFNKSLLNVEEGRDSKDM